MAYKSINTIFQRMGEYGDRPAIWYRGKEYSYLDLLERTEEWKSFLALKNIENGELCVVVGDYSLETCSLILALIKTNCIVQLVSSANEGELQSQVAESGAKHLIQMNEYESWGYQQLGGFKSPGLIKKFSEQKKSGLIFFTSGTAGKAKGILHDTERVFQKFVHQRRAWKTIMFLALDHFGGFNTLLSVFAYGGKAICLENRSVQHVCKTISKTKADLLPTTPTFLNFLLGSKRVLVHDVSSIKRISYGTEMMREDTLKRLQKIFPDVKMVNTYGLSEIGVLRTKSKANESLWVKVGGQGFETKIIDNVLWIRSTARMEGYFNAPSAIDENGWMCTNDRVEEDGGYIKFLGRQSDIINVGGQKVASSEVEEVIITDRNVLEVLVYGVENELLGEVVVAEVSLKEAESENAVFNRLRAQCKKNLSRFKVPVRFKIVAASDQYNLRFKRVSRK